MHRFKQQGGFSLIEILMAILIAGIIAAIAIPVFNGQRTKAKNAAAQRAVEDGVNAAMAYFTQGETFSGFTPTVLAQYETTLTGATNTTAANDCPSGTSGCTAASSNTDAQVRSLFIADYDGGIAVTDIPGAAGTANQQGVSFCTASRGDATYCARVSGTAAAQYGWANTAATNNGAEGNAAATITTGGTGTSSTVAGAIAGGWHSKWPAN